MLGVAVAIDAEPGSKIVLEGCILLSQGGIATQAIAERELIQVTG